MAFASPVSRLGIHLTLIKQYGDTLYRERVHMTQKTSKFTFVTDSLPEKAGVDPFALLIDRVPDDNVKPVTLLDGISPARNQSGASPGAE